MNYVKEISEAWIEDNLDDLDSLIDTISDRKDFMDIIKETGRNLKDNDFIQYLYEDYIHCGDTYYFETKLRENLYDIDYDSKLIVIPVSGKTSDIENFDINLCYPLLTSTGVVDQYSSIMLYSHIIPQPKDLIPLQDIENLLKKFNLNFINQGIEKELAGLLESGKDIFDINKDYIIKPVTHTNQIKFDELCKPFFVDNFNSDNHQSGLIIGVFSKINIEYNEEELNHTKKLFNAFKKLHPKLTFGRIRLYSDFINQ